MDKFDRINETRNLLCDILETPGDEILATEDAVVGNYPTWALRLAEMLIWKGWRQSISCGCKGDGLPHIHGNIPKETGERIK